VSLRDRGRLRRRLRFLRRARELQLRDLGGLVFDLYRFGQQREPLVRGKLDAVIATDHELRSLEDMLADPRATREVRRPSVGGACPGCNALYPSDASFCSECGLALAADVEAPAQPNADERDAQTREIATPDGWAGTQPQASEQPPPVTEEEM
jgi:hypothetical protein